MYTHIYTEIAENRLLTNIFDLAWLMLLATIGDLSYNGHHDGQCGCQIQSTSLWKCVFQYNGGARVH